MEWSRVYFEHFFRLRSGAGLLGPKRLARLGLWMPVVCRTGDGLGVFWSLFFWSLFVRRLATIFTRSAGKSFPTAHTSWLDRRRAET